MSRQLPHGAPKKRTSRPQPTEVPQPEIIVVDDIESVSDLVDTILFSYSCDPTTPTLALDLEGVLLERGGEISILQIYREITQTVYLVDILTLKDRAFNVSGSDMYSHYTLTTILQDPKIKKLMFDRRRDNDALYNLYVIKLAGAFDLQLGFCATRSEAKNRTTVEGIEQALSLSGIMTNEAKKQWKVTQNWGKACMVVGPEETNPSQVHLGRALSQYPESSQL